MRALADLHVHSDRSDGLQSPKELVRLAEKKGLGGLALTDHDTLDGIPEFLATPTTSDIVLVPGVEVSTEYLGKEVHILGYFVPYGESPIEERLRVNRESRRTRFPKMVKKLRDMGIEIDENEVQRIIREVESPGRPHLARILIEMGVVSDINEAFKKYLATGKPAYVRRDKIDIEEGIRLLRKSGAVPVLAHPLLSENMDMREFIQTLKQYGIEGVEVEYGYRKQELLDQIEEIREITANLGLIATGGSDFHGDDGHFELGSVVTSIETIDNLRMMAEHFRKNDQ